MKRLALLGMLCVGGLLWGWAADAPAQEERIQAQIEAGEFAPAAALARQAADPKQRDALLGQIAVAQAQAGARNAAVRSVAEIGDDRARAHILAQVGNAPPGGNANQNQNQGGANQADFDALLHDLITQTVAPKTWVDNGGLGSLQPFPTGVWVDPRGVLQPLVHEEQDAALDALRTASAPVPGGLSRFSPALAKPVARDHARRGARNGTVPFSDDARRPSPLRMISLTRLEKQVQLGLAVGQPPTDVMQAMAGLQRVKYVFVYPESGDLVLAGPAGDWTTGPEGRIVGTDSGAPVVQLEDLVVVLRHMIRSADAKFGCLITPRQEALARVQVFLNRLRNVAVAVENRNAWLERFRAQLGKQDIEVYGLDPRTRAARIIVEADYRMKLVGMGLEGGVPGVVSYLNLIKLGPGESPPPMGVLRWWFTLNYDAVLASKDRQAFAIRGQGVKVESENERLTAEGKRIHPGQSEALNRQFARSFTEHFEALCRRYPVYAELRNLCDLALAAALIREEKLAETIDWHLTCFGDPQGYPVALGEAPKEVETVVNYRVVNHKTFVAGVSGGVRVSPAALVQRQVIEVEGYPGLEKQRPGAAPRRTAGERWWWD